MGLAKTLFAGNKEKKAAWPILDKMLSSTALNYVDYALAKHLKAQDEASAAFICHLSLAAREGHLCVQINDRITPSVKQLWSTDQEIDSSDVEILTNLIQKGRHSISQEAVNDSFTSSPLVRFGDLFYFQRYWMRETAVLKHFQELQKYPPKIQFDSQSLQNQVDLLLGSKKLLPEQAQAILKAASQTFTIICGGPGTGKTYTAAILLKLFLDEMKGPCEIALAAPTGKAAANLQKNMLTGLPPATTLHSLLGIRKEGLPKKLSADLILVDECSMIDANLMEKLISSVKPGARLIFLGDRNQLPPVEAGSLFTDMIAAYPSCAVFLKTCLRAELQEIVDFAEKINQGDDVSVLQMLDTGHAVKRLAGNPLSYERFPGFIDADFDPITLLHSFNEFRVLSPLRKGPFGVDQVNHYFFSNLVQKRAHTSALAIPIMICKNDNRTELFNGETGVLILQANKNGDNFPQEGDYALFPCKENGFRRIPALLLPKYEYAYCLSVHKSQGSEFNHVLLLMPEGSQHFGREVLYTAATRARKSLQIYGDNEVLRSTIKTPGCRLSGFTKRLTWN